MIVELFLGEGRDGVGSTTRGLAEVTALLGGYHEPERNHDGREHGEQDSDEADEYAAGHGIPSRNPRP